MHRTRIIQQLRPRNCGCCYCVIVVASADAVLQEVLICLENIWKMAAFGTQCYSVAELPQGFQHPGEQGPVTPTTVLSYKNRFFFSSFDPVDVNIMQFFIKTTLSYCSFCQKRQRVHNALLALMQTMKLSNRLSIALTQKLEKM